MKIWQFIGVRHSFGSNRLQELTPIRLWTSLRFWGRQSHRPKCLENNRICFTSLKLQQKALSDGNLQAALLDGLATRSADRAPSFDEVTRGGTCSSVKGFGVESCPRKAEAPSTSKLHPA